MANLFIIGNGFDLAHGIKSSYDDFRIYLQDKYSHNKFKNSIPTIFINKKNCSDFQSAHLLIKLISIAEKNGNLWRNFEESLGLLDYSIFYKNHHENYYIETVNKSLIISIPKIKQFFCDWIKNLKVENVSKIDAFTKLINPEEDYFITFNYTDLLEKIYQVKNICHIHGMNENDIIMGHGNTENIQLIPISNYSKSNIKLFNIIHNDSNQNFYLSDKNLFDCLKLLEMHKSKNGIGKIQKTLIDNLLFSSVNRGNNFLQKINHTEDIALNTQLFEIKNTLQTVHKGLQKNSNYAIKTLIKFINSMRKDIVISNIYSIGFSYSNIDMKLIEIISMLDANKWYINNYKNDELDSFIKKIKKCSFRGKICKFNFTQY